MHGRIAQSNSLDKIVAAFYLVVHLDMEASIFLSWVVLQKQIIYWIFVVIAKADYDRHSLIYRHYICYNFHANFVEV